MHSLTYQTRSISLEPSQRSSKFGLSLFAGLSRRGSKRQSFSQFSNLERRLSTSNDEIQNISPKAAKLISQTYNIKYAYNQFIDREDEKITYTIVEGDVQNSISFKEVLLVSPIHHSLCLGKRYCYRIVVGSNAEVQKMIVFKCKNQKERDYWMKEIRCALKNVSDFLITEENSLKILIQECRNLTVKNKYFCEVKLDDLIYARTSVKEMRDICFWGEEFDLTGLSDIKLISITIWRLQREKEKEHNPQIVSHVNMSIDSIDRHCITEKWYSPSPVFIPNLTENPTHSLTFSAACDVDNPPDLRQKDKKLPNQITDSAPLLRIKSRYFPLKVLDSKFYSEIFDFLKRNGVDLFRELDRNLKAKYREELILPMVQLAIRKQWIDEFLSELILRESKSCDINIILRGNSMATKAVECFLKIECGDYLREILGDLIKDIMYSHNDLEIDRVKLLKMRSSISTAALKKRVKTLEKLVDKVLMKIFNSAEIIPRRVRLVFNRVQHKLRGYEMTSSGFTEKVVSACFFLRLVCPAIMTPYLFQLLPEYSQNSDINRSFTLVAKCVQNVANFAGIDDQKESYMATMVLFCRDYYNHMHRFLDKILTVDESGPYDSSDRNPLPNYDQIGFGIEMARLCYHIEYCLSTFADEKSSPLENEAKYLIQQLKGVENQLSVGTDTMERKYAALEFTESGKPLRNTIESSGYFSMHDYPVSGSSQRPGQLNDGPMSKLSKSSSQSKLQIRNLPKSTLSTHSFSSKTQNYPYEDVLSLRKMINLEKDRLNLMREVVTQYQKDDFHDESTKDLQLTNLDNPDLIASSKQRLQKYIDYACQCLNKVEHCPESDSSNIILEKIIKMNSSLQMILVKSSKDSSK